MRSRSHSTKVRGAENCGWIFSTLSSAPTRRRCRRTHCLAFAPLRARTQEEDIAPQIYSRPAKVQQQLKKAVSRERHSRLSMEVTACDDEDHAKKIQLRRSTAVDLERRQSLKSLFGMTFFSTAAPAMAADGRSRPPAVKGAAELDLEYYLRAIVNGNPKQGVDPSGNGNGETTTVQFVRESRSLKGPFLALLLHDMSGDDETNDLAGGIALEELVRSSGRTSSQIMASLQRYREATSRAFYAEAPWKEERISDSNYWDFTCYALWRTAADALDGAGKNFALRDDYMRSIGRRLYAQARKQRLLPTTTSSETATTGSTTTTPLTSSLQQIRRILTLFQQSGFCTSFRIARGTSVGENDANGDVFDTLDDEDFISGSVIDCLVSVYNPATLGSALQITGERSRFTPEFVANTLAAVWESDASAVVTWETYFVDPVYRPNPKDYFPNEELIQFSLRKKI